MRRKEGYSDSCHDGKGTFIEDTCHRRVRQSAARTAGSTVTEHGGITEWRLLGCHREQASLRPSRVLAGGRQVIGLEGGGFPTN